MEGYLIIGYGLTPLLCTRSSYQLRPYFPVFLDDGNIFNVIVIYFSLCSILFNRTCSPPKRVVFLAVSSLLSTIVTLLQLCNQC